MFSKYGKSSANMMRHKRSFFEENDQMLLDAKYWAEFYSRQPKRDACKNCAAPAIQVIFEKYGVGYFICDECGHLNGAHEDTEEFTSAIYTEDGGEKYAEAYSSVTQKEWLVRRNDIYLPKASFLIDFLCKDHCIQELGFADIGAGSGYFVSALLEAGAQSVQGFEVSKTQVLLANSMLGQGYVELHQPDDTEAIVGALKFNVVSMIGVLEHLRNPRDILGALTRNENVDHLYISLPLFSLSVFIELAFPEVMPRHLTGGHTHLYTEQSIKHLIAEYGWKISGQWWFGNDLVDLYRSMLVRLEKTHCIGDGQIKKKFGESLIDSIDSMQLVLDTKHASSEVHLILSRESS